MNTTEDLIQAVQAESEATRDEPYTADAEAARPNRARSVVQSVRLPADGFAESRDERESTGGHGARVAHAPADGQSRGYGFRPPRCQVWTGDRGGRTGRDP